MTPGYEADMRRIIGRDVAVRTHARGVMVSLPCSGGHIIEHDMEKMLPPDALKRKLSNRGWLLGKRLTCPDCKRKKPMPTEAPAPILRTATDTVSPSEAAKVQRRLAYTAVEDAYDEKRRCYKPGNTDASIAATVGCAANLVAGIRDEFFGPATIPEPPEVAALRKDIAEMLDTARAMQAEGRGMATRATNVENKAKALTERVDALVKSNGWPS